MASGGRRLGSSLAGTAGLGAGVRRRGPRLFAHVREARPRVHIAAELVRDAVRRRQAVELLPGHAGGKKHQHLRGRARRTLPGVGIRLLPRELPEPRAHRTEVGRYQQHGRRPRDGFLRPRRADRGLLVPKRVDERQQRPANTAKGPPAIDDDEHQDAAAAPAVAEVPRLRYAVQETPAFPAGDFGPARRTKNQPVAKPGTAAAATAKWHHSEGRCPLQNTAADHYQHRDHLRERKHDGPGHVPKRSLGDARTPVFYRGTLPRSAKDRKRTRPPRRKALHGAGSGCSKRLAEFRRLSHESAGQERAECVRL
mmetsp:Transcript_106606/g.217493  ORF Transcript_106606/g.217493 Transcript_106606/m.217493 type:complete len:311 (-) Transcript_106606:1261-2193(-)